MALPPLPRRTTMEGYTGQQQPQTQQARYQPPQPQYQQQPMGPMRQPAGFTPGMAMADPFSAAGQRAQARLDAGRVAEQQALATRLQGFGQTRNRYLDDAEFALRTGADANMRSLTGRDAVHSGLRDRFAERLQGAVGRPLLRGLEDLGDQENLAQQQIAERIASLEGSLPVMQAEELSRQYGMDAQQLSNAVNEAAMTGRFVPGPAKTAMNQVLLAKDAYARAQANGDTAGMDAAHQMAEQARTVLTANRIDPNLFGADVASDAAARNVANAGTLTPAAREMAAALSGIDPTTGQQTLTGLQSELGRRQSEQNLAMGDLELSIAQNPEYGAAAEARTRIALSQANAAAAARRGTTDTTGELKGLSSTRADVVGKWNLSDTGLTTNWAALDQLLEQIAGQALSGETNMEDVEAFLAEQATAMRQMGVDPRAVRAAVGAFLQQTNTAQLAPDMLNAISLYRAGERSQSFSTDIGAPAAGGATLNPGNAFDLRSSPVTTIPSYGARPDIPPPAPPAPGRLSPIPSYWSRNR